MRLRGRNQQPDVVERLRSVQKYFPKPYTLNRMQTSGVSMTRIIVEMLLEGGCYLSYSEVPRGVQTCTDDHIYSHLFLNIYIYANVFTDSRVYARAFKFTF